MFETYQTQAQKDQLKQTSKRRIRSYQIDQQLGTCFKLKVMFKTSRTQLTQVSGDTGPLFVS